MTIIPLSLVSWELDTDTGVVTATFTDAPRDGEADPAGHQPVETHVVEIASTKHEVFKWPRNERAAKARANNPPPA